MQKRPARDPAFEEGQEADNHLLPRAHQDGFGGDRNDRSDSESDERQTRVARGNEIHRALGADRKHQTGPIDRDGQSENSDELPFPQPKRAPRPGPSERTKGWRTD
jgi:hypothetical protein